MKIGSAMKWIMGLLSIVPPITFIGSNIFVLMHSTLDNMEVVSRIGDYADWTGIVALLLCFWLFTSYIIRTDDERLKSKKVEWIALIFLGYILTIPIFWFIYLLPITSKRRGELRE
jgi:hypothetical protein